MGDGKWVKMVESGQQRVTIQMCHIPNADEAKKNPQYGTKNLSRGAKSRVRVLADIQNFTLRAHCMHGIPWVFGWGLQARSFQSHAQCVGGGTRMGQHGWGGGGRIKTFFACCGHGAPI